MRLPTLPSLFVLCATLCSCKTTAQAADAAVHTPAASLGQETYTELDSLQWTTRLEDAQRIAKKHDLEVLAVFAGSDWCRPCKQFRQSVLEDSAFAQPATREVVILYLDFPSKKRNALSPSQTAHNEALAERLNPEGIFPRIFLLDDNGQPTREIPYKGQDATSYLDLLTGA